MSTASTGRPSCRLLPQPTSPQHQRGRPTVMSQELCSSQSKGAQRAPTRSQLKVGFPSRLLTQLWTRHIHWENAAPSLTSGGSRLQQQQGVAGNSRCQKTAGTTQDGWRRADSSSMWLVETAVDTQSAQCQGPTGDVLHFCGQHSCSCSSPSACTSHLPPTHCAH